MRMSFIVIIYKGALSNAFCHWHLKAPKQTRPYHNRTSPVLPSKRFSQGTGLLYHYCRVLFFMSTGWSDTNNKVFIPCNANFTRGTLPRNLYFSPRNAIFTEGFLSSSWIGLVLSSSREGFVVKTWQPWTSLLFRYLHPTRTYTTQQRRWWNLLCRPRI